MATRRSEPPRAAAAVFDAGRLQVALPIDPALPVPPAACFIDDAFQGLADITDGAAAVSLPRHLLAQKIDLRDVRTGRSLLQHPIDAAPYYRFALDDVAAREQSVQGSFALADWAGPALLVETLRDGEVPHQVVAVQSGAGDGLARYSFAVPVTALIPINQTATLSLRIGGHAAASVDLSPSDMGYLGYLDYGSGKVQGWAASLGKFRRRVAVDIRIDGEVIATVPANLPRADVRAIGVENDRCGFSMTLPPEYEDGRGFELSAVLAGTGIHLCNSPVRVAPSMQVEGYFDNCHGTSAHGWAINRRKPKVPVVVEAVLPDGRVIGKAEAKLFRGDLLDAGLADGLCAFKIDLGQQFLDLVGQSILVRVAGTGEYLQGSPKLVELNPNLVRFARRRDEVAPEVLPRLKARLNQAAGGLGVSIVMPVYNTPRAWLMEAIESVHGQWCDQWELICVNDSSTEPHVAQVLAIAAQREPRIRVLNAPVNGGIAAATNYGIRAARFGYIAFMDHDDCLEPDAVWQLVRAAKSTDADFIYSDETTTDEHIAGVSDVKCRPAFSYDYYLSHPYFVHMLCVRASIAQRIGGWDQAMPISADVDFVLRVLEHARNVVHVPAVLYRWRTHGGSAGHASQSRVMEATRGALQRHLDRRGTGAVVHDGVGFNQFRIEWPEAPGQVLIVIPTRNKLELLRTAIDSIEATSDGVDYRIVVIDHQSTDPETKRYLKTLGRRHTVMPYKGEFNYSRMNNLAVATHGAGAEYVLFLNNDVEAIEDGWLDRMRRLAQRPDVGCVGALLLYADRRVQHAGVILGFNGSADHAMKFQDAYVDRTDRRSLGYNCSLTSVRDFSAVTAACMMMRREAFLAVGGFDERYAVGFNDTDLCLRVREQGLKVLYDGGVVLYHYESATRSDTKQVMHPEDTSRLLLRWDGILSGGDPFYNPLLSDRVQDHVLREDPGCQVVHAPRVTPISLGGSEARRPVPAPARRKRRTTEVPVPVLVEDLTEI